MIPDDNELLTLDQAASLIPGADANTLRRRIRQGKLQAYRPGKAYLTTRADLVAMLEACRVVPADEKRRPKTPQTVPNQLGLTSTDLAKMALDRALERLG